MGAWIVGAVLTFVATFMIAMPIESMICWALWCGFVTGLKYLSLGDLFRSRTDLSPLCMVVMVTPFAL